MSYFSARAITIGVLEERFGTTPGFFVPAYERALSSLRNDDLGKLADEKQPDDAEHFRKHWLDGDWWGGDAPVHDTLRDGLIEAIDEARREGKPLGAIWLPGASDTFEAVVTTGAHQVTLLILTPKPRNAEEASS